MVGNHESSDRERCETDGCHRKAEYLFTADTDADGEVLPEDGELKRPFCEPCKEAAEWIQAWHPADFSFRYLHTASSQEDR